MDKTEAQRRFLKADKLYMYGRFDDVLVELELLDSHFPGNHRILNAKARTLDQLGRFDDALAVCDRLLDEFAYEKVRPLRDSVAAKVEPEDDAPQQVFWSNETGAVRVPAHVAPPGEPAKTPKPAAGRFRIKPLRLALLVLVILLTYFGYIPYALGISLIVAWFAVKWLIGAAISKLFQAPFKMKGKALAAATSELHGFMWTEKPARAADDDSDDDEEDDDGGAGPRKNLRYVWLDVTITPQPGTEGFTHWEPGELMLAPLAMKIAGLDALEDCFRIHDVKLIENGEEIPDEGMKYQGPKRLKLLASVPPDEGPLKFVYYFEQFGELHLNP